MKTVRRALLAFVLLLASVPLLRAEVPWPLPVPRDITIESMADFHGVIYRMNGRAFQIDQVAWVIHDYELSILAVNGYLEDGTAFSYTRNIPQPGHTTPYYVVEELDGFRNFRLNNGFDPLFVASITWGTTNLGFLRIIAANGVTNITQEPFSITAGGGPCANVTEQSCRNRNCIDSFPCGTAPACLCKLGGGCDPITSQYCEGPPCPANQICNNRPGACACVDLVAPPPTPPDPPTPTDPPTEPPAPPATFQRCPSYQHVDPSTGHCGPDICYVCIYG